MEAQAKTNGDGASLRTNLGALLSGVTVSAAGPPEGGEKLVADQPTSAEADISSAPVNGNGNGNGAAVPQNGTGTTSETVVEETVQQADPNAKFVFRTWLMIEVFLILKNFLRHVKPEELFSEGNGPDRQHDSGRIQGGWKKLKKLHAAIGDTEKWRSMLISIISGIEEKVGGSRQFSFVDAAKNTKVLKEVGFGLAWALDTDGRAELTSSILVLEENDAWFSNPEVVEADYQTFLEANRRREAERDRKRLAREAEEARIDELSEIGDLLAVAQDVGIELATVMDRETIKAAQARLPEVGDTVELKIDQLMVGQNDEEGQSFVSGIRFERITGRKERPFLPARFIPDRWRRLEDETVEEYEQRLKASMASGALLSVEKVERDGRGYRILVQIRTYEEIVAIKSHGKKVPFARPPRKLEVGESVNGRVVGRSQHGVRVAFRGGAQLFAHVSNIADGLSLKVGDTVYGIVIPGYGGRGFDFTIREVVTEESDDDPPPEWIIHPERVEEIRRYVVDSGIELDEAKQAAFREIAEMASTKTVLADGQAESIDAFFGELLKDADRRFESIVVLKDYRREQEAANTQIVADSRPFCVNHAEDEHRGGCNRRVAEEGQQCLRCEKRDTQRKPTPGGKKRGLKCRKS